MRHNSLLVIVVLSLLAASSGQDTADRHEHRHPRIVATFQLFGQTGSTSPATIYTPKRGGMFRVNTFLVLTVNGGGPNGYLDAQLGFTDQRGPDTQLVFPVAIYPKTDANGTAVNVLVDEGGQPITFSVIVQFASLKYDVFVTVEELWSTPPRAESH